MLVLTYEKAMVEAVVASCPDTGPTSAWGQSGILLLVLGRYFAE
jgi:hypothetical protein